VNNLSARADVTKIAAKTKAVINNGILAKLNMAFFLPISLSFVNQRKKFTQ